MFILKITNKITGQVQQSEFQTRIECDQHFDFYNAQGFWGKDAYVIPATYDENGIELSPEIPYEAEFIKEIIDVTAQYELAKRISDLVDSGKKDEAVCKQCLNLIGGYNKERSLSSAQIQSMVASFANIDFCLSKFMPKSAKVLIVAITPDESIITTELKNLMLEILKEY